MTTIAYEWKKRKDTLKISHNPTITLVSEMKEKEIIGHPKIGKKGRLG